MKIESKNLSAKPNTSVNNFNGIHLRKHLNGDSLYQELKKAFEGLPDNRKGKITYALADALMSACCIFTIKDPSLLHFEGRLKNSSVAYNLKKIFKIKEIPSDTQLRELIDTVDTKLIAKVFKKIFSHVQRGKGLESFKFLNKYYIASMDGTGYFSSEKVHCENCLTQVSRSGRITYSHKMLGIAIVHPDKKHVIPLAPEAIIKQDGQTKNDSERNASKRLIRNLRNDHPHLPVLIVEDGLASNAPHIQELEQNGFKYILGAKPGDHKHLFNKFEIYKGIEGMVTTLEKEENGVISKLQFRNKIPINDSNKDVEINFLHFEEKKNGRTTKFTWVTNLEINEENAFEIARGGRARWKIENETFNTLKNQGYQFEHNFGHGKKNLSVNFAHLMMLAFLIDQVQELYCPLFKAALAKEERRKYLWDTIRSYFKTLHFQSWEILLQAVTFGLENVGYVTRPNTS